MDSPSQKKRQSRQASGKLEEEVKGPSRKKARLSSDPLDPALRQFLVDMIEKESLIEPQICQICDRTIGKAIKVKCAECPAVLCLECLRTGNEREDLPHQKGHSYFVIDNLSFPLFSKEWQAKEELLLIQGIMKCGLGNWIDISDQYVRTKTAQECEEHYFSFYYKSKEDPKPREEELVVAGQRVVRGQVGVLEVDEKKQALSLQKIEAYQEKRKKEVEKEEQEFQPSAVQNNEWSQEVGIRPGKKREGSAVTQVSKLVGYMPKRGDFEQEFDMDADLLLADMEFFDDDIESDIKLKNEVIELYNARLDERIRRKKFVIERGILDFKRIQKYERKKTKEEREIINTMKVFARFNSAEEHERIVNALLKERLLREVIEQLKFFKSKGLTSMDQIEKFIDSQKKKQSATFSAGHDKNSYYETQEYIRNPREFISPRSNQFLENMGLQRAAGVEKANYGTTYGMPRFDELENKEKELVSQVGISPAEYLKLKQKIIQEAAQNKALSEQMLGKMPEFKNHKEKIDKLFEFWVKVSLVKRQN